MPTLSKPRIFSNESRTPPGLQEDSCMIKTEISDLLSKLGAAEKAALRLLIDLPGPHLDPDSEKHFSGLAWGGVILFEKNIESRQQVVSLLSGLQGISLSA